MDIKKLITRIEKIKYENLRYNSPESMLLEQKHLILDLVEQFDEQQKSVVPEFVAEWIEYAKKKGDGLRESFSPWTLYGAEYSKANRWIDENQETFAEAWLFGYEVEKEQLYYVRLPFDVWNEESAEIETEYLYLGYDNTSDETRMFTTKEARKGFNTKLEEVDIKSINEKYWAFAAPVEEVAEG